MQVPQNSAERETETGKENVGRVRKDRSRGLPGETTATGQAEDAGEVYTQFTMSFNCITLLFSEIHHPRKLSWHKSDN